VPGFFHGRGGLGICLGLGGDELVRRLLEIGVGKKSVGKAAGKGSIEVFFFGKGFIGQVKLLREIGTEAAALQNGVLQRVPEVGAVDAQGAGLAFVYVEGFEIGFVAFGEKGRERFAGSPEFEI